jgi:phospholipid/cholesterol/gamma-HCH transport system permease protein
MQGDKDRVSDHGAVMEAGDGTLRFSGPLGTAEAASLWARAMEAARHGASTIDARGVVSLSGTGAVLLAEVARRAGDAPIEPPGEHAAAETLKRMSDALAAAPSPAPPPRVGMVTRTGQLAIGAVKQCQTRVGFLGEVTLGWAGLLARPWRLRLSELFRHLDEAGTRGFALCMLLGTLIGVILAFQSAIPMRKFGAETFVPQLVGISLVRELGPLIAAIVLAGRTASAYAAELGTMKVNEEIDALSVMGIDPVAWLVLPRILAAGLVMPVLALVMNLTGLVGMGFVMHGLGIPPSMVMNSLQDWVSIGDLWGGLFKALIFGLTIGMIGCRSGLKTGGGPRAVGDAATSAVVGSLVAVVVLDGLFAVIFFRLGW